MAVPALSEVPLPAEPLDRLLGLVDPDMTQRAVETAEALRRRMAGRVVWSINSTASGGGVAEMLTALLPYVRGAGIDARWLFIHGDQRFFRITKRLHHALHGSRGDGTALDSAARAIYEQVTAENVAGLMPLIGPDDVVVLHDPQTAGLAPRLAARGALVLWRCHIGWESSSEESEAGWQFLEPYLEAPAAMVFSREAYAPAPYRNRSVIIPPSIDPFSPKNQELAPLVAAAILLRAGLVGGEEQGSPRFERGDGSTGRVERRAEVIRSGKPPLLGDPLVVQVSRWDSLKDPVGVLRGFTGVFERGLQPTPHLVLAGPAFGAVADDPEEAEVHSRVLAAWEALPESQRRLVHLASLPMDDVEENAAIVNALQRQAAVIVQKSVREGFGLTVTEAMWKERAVVASAVGGIVDQIVDGEEGILLTDPSDLDAFAAAVSRVLADSNLARRLGLNARERVRRDFLPVRHLLQFAELVDRLLAGRP